jgi:hypothetical protein
VRGLGWSDFFFVLFCSAFCALGNFWIELLGWAGLKRIGLDGGIGIGIGIVFYCGDGADRRQAAEFNRFFLFVCLLLRISFTILHLPCCVCYSAQLTDLLLMACISPSSSHDLSAARSKHLDFRYITSPPLPPLSTMTSSDSSLRNYFLLFTVFCGFLRFCGFVGSW